MLANGQHNRNCKTYGTDMEMSCSTALACAPQVCTCPPAGLLKHVCCMNKPILKVLFNHCRVVTSVCVDMGSNRATTLVESNSPCIVLVARSQSCLVLQALRIGVLATASVFQLFGRIAHSFLAQSEQRLHQLCLTIFGTWHILSFESCCADDLLHLHDGDLDELGVSMWAFFSPAVAQYLQAAAIKDDIPVPAMQDVSASGLGSLVVSNDAITVFTCLPYLYDPHKM